MLAAHANAAKPGTPAMATPATAVLKKLPGRAVSTDIRIISDLRLPNLFCAKENYPPAHLTDIMEISEGAVTDREANVAEH